MKHAATMVLRIAAIGLVGWWTAVPVTAQMGKQGGARSADSTQAQRQGMGMMGGMHQSDMMQQMSEMMSHMTQMMGRMSESMQQMRLTQEHFEQMQGAASEEELQAVPTMSSLASMADEMGAVMPHWDAMLEEMRALTDSAAAGGSAANMRSMQSLMDHMESMIEGGNETMGSLAAAMESIARR